MKKLKKWFLNLSIQRKYLYCTLSITLVVLLAASFFQFMSASETVTEQTVKQSAGVINELSVNLDHYFDMVENSFEYIANSSIVQEVQNCQRNCSTNDAQYHTLEYKRCSYKTVCRTNKFHNTNFFLTY